MKMEDRNEKDRGLTVNDIAQAVEETAPAALQEAWDNSGLLIGFGEKRVDKLLICLEIDERVADEAADMGAEMVITHHPLIFDGIKALDSRDADDRAVMKLIEAGISVYSCHTPFDKVKGGNNDALAAMIGLSSVRNLRGGAVAAPSKMIAEYDEADIGRMGRFKKAMSCREALNLVAAQLEMSLRQLRFVGDLDREVTTVGLCTGAGADLMKLAAEAGCQLFITGDVKYHEARYALAHDICVIDAGHYGTEKHFAATMKAMLEKKLPDVEMSLSAVDLEPFRMM